MVIQACSGTISTLIQRQNNLSMLLRCCEPTGLCVLSFFFIIIVVVLSGEPKQNTGRGLVDRKLV